MSTVIRTTISKKNPYYIPKHRYLELKHFCMQYYDWDKEYRRLLDKAARGTSIIFLDTEGMNRTLDIGLKLAELSRKMNLVKKCCKLTDEVLGDYIFKAVTEEKSYEWLRTMRNIPCGKSMYYNFYRRFWWILDWKSQE